MRIRNLKDESIDFTLDGQQFTLAPSEELDFEPDDEQEARDLIEATDGLALVTSTGEIELANEFSDGYDGGADFDGDAEYVLRELKLAVRGIMRRIDGCATKSEIQTVWRSAERTFADKKDCHASLNKLAKDQDIHKVYCTDVEISSAELLALNATPKELISAPGADSYIDVVSMQLFLDYNSTAYSLGANNDLSLEFDGGDQLVVFEGTGFLDATADARKSWHHPSVPLDTNTEKALMLKMLDSEITLGDSPLKIRVCYRIEELLK